MNDMAVVSAPESSPAVAPPAEPVSRLRALINERFGETKEPPPGQDTAEGVSPGADPDQAVRDDESKPDESDVKDEPKTPARIELQLARAQAEIRKVTAEHVRSKSAAEKATKELETFRADFERNPLLALEKVSGRPIAEIFAEARAGKYDVAPEPSLPPEIQSLVEREKTRVAEEQAASVAKAREAEQEQAAPRVRELIDVAADKYPYLLSPGAEYAVVEAIYDRIDKGESPDVQDVIAFVHDAAKDRSHFWYTNEAVLRHALSDPKIRACIEGALGTSKTTPSGKSETPAKVPPASVGTLSEVGSRREAAIDPTREIAEAWTRARNASR